MLWPAIFANCAVGAVVALFFVLFYLNGEASGNLKLAIEAIIGIGGNGALAWVVFAFIPEDEPNVRLVGLACCYAAFLVVTGILLCIFAFVIKDRDANSVIRLRDIFLGQYSFVKKHYEQRAQEIDNKLNIESLKRRENTVEQRENAVAQRENKVSSAEKYIADELARIERLGKKRLRINLPENRNVTLSQDYISTMPSYIADFFACIQHIHTVTEDLLKEIADSNEENSEGNTKKIDIPERIHTYFLTIAGHISADLFGGNSSDARIHFRIYNRKNDGYEKYLALMGSDTNVLFQPMTFIPYGKTNMIARSYECRRALIMSLNSGHHFEGNNHKVWKEYLTYTFTNLLIDEKPFLSFGISIKAVDRYKKNLHLINYFRLEAFLQNNIERVHNAVNLASIFYGGTT